MKTALRQYQRRAVALGKQQSLIVVLPTGSGKTLVASKIAAYHARNGSKILFLVPTCLLVQQQAKAIRDENDVAVVEYMGSASVPSLLFDVLVSTPAAFISLNASNPNFRYEAFGYFVFDEVHHVIKKHPYRKIARSLACVSPPPLILGLTASLTYAMGAARIQEAIVELCAELNLSGNCIFSVSPETLIPDGYHSNVSSSVMLSNDFSLDSSGNGLEIPGKPHQVMPDFMRCYEARSLHILSLGIVDSIYRVEKLIKEFDAAFVSPVGASGERGKSANWSSYTNRRKKMFSGANSSLYVVLEHLFIRMYKAANQFETNSP
jgi:hypothetical protein